MIFIFVFQKTWIFQRPTLSFSVAKIKHIQSIRSNCVTIAWATDVQVNYWLLNACLMGRVLFIPSCIGSGKSGADFNPRCVERIGWNNQRVSGAVTDRQNAPLAPSHPPGAAYIWMSGNSIHAHCSHRPAPAKAGMLAGLNRSNSLNGKYEMRLDCRPEGFVLF